MVVALIVALVGGASLALRDTASSSLASAQSVVGSLVSLARAQAAVNQTEARLVINNVRPTSFDPDLKYLRLCQVFISATPGATNPTSWTPVGAPVYLPKGTFIVPANTTGLLAAGITWPANPAPVSTLGTAGQLAGQAAGTAFASTNQVMYVEFKPDGTPSVSTSLTAAATTIKIAVTSGTLTAAGLPSFTNQFAVRGVLIRPSGAVSYVSDATGF